jgi:hypothetical protein
VYKGVGIYVGVSNRCQVLCVYVKESVGIQCGPDLVVESPREVGDRGLEVSLLQGPPDSTERGRGLLVRPCSGFRAPNTSKTTSQEVVQQSGLDIATVASQPLS